MTYDLEVTDQDETLIGFERPLGGILPGYPVMRLATDTALAVVGPRAFGIDLDYEPALPSST